MGSCCCCCWRRRRCWAQVAVSRHGEGALVAALAGPREAGGGMLLLMRPDLP